MNKMIWMALFVSLSAQAAETTAYLYRFTGDNPAGAVVLHQGDKAAYYECPVIALVVHADPVVLRSVCRGDNEDDILGPARPLIGDRFVPENVFAFSHSYTRPRRYAHGEVSQHLVASGSFIEGYATYFDPAKPEWMFRKGSRVFISSNFDEEPRVYSTFFSTYVLMGQEKVHYPALDAGRTTGPLAQ